VPRVGPAVVRSPWQHRATLDGRHAWIDLRDVGAAAAERASDWQVELVARDGAHELFVYLAASGDDPGPAVGLYEDLARIGTAPTQIALGTSEDLAERRARAPGPWQRYWAR
jgi:hypothetical protein